ncbi:universal stress protein [Kutzneria buriramensis]|uniref:Nucleotide-binding universal stress UspA family protein n=1 Tax=Kutzneria buriramensis TaxID=1045776 RepID=A0A3E0GXY4_9PSEU|nr:universal stress protein [Kutzneria buriramensis]REH34809.1 nucleotide-binding universal stress UspA family protein [Kutzneria buriramensis]
MTRAPIVAAIDGSDSARQAVLWAAQEATRRGIGLTIVHVAPDLAAALAQGRSWLDETSAAARRAAPTVTTSAEMMSGSVVETLTAVSTWADTVVLGTRGIGGFTGLLAGSVAIGVSTRARCPVVVVRAPAPASGPIVVGVDGGSAEEATEWAFTEAALRDAPLIAVHTWTEGALSRGWDTVPYVVDFQALNDSMRGMLSDRVAPWREKFPSVRLDLVTALDNPARALVDQSRHAQLVVVGTRRHRPLAGALLGSTSHALLHHAACPVVVVHADS